MFVEWLCNDRSASIIPGSVVARFLLNHVEFSAWGVRACYALAGVPSLFCFEMNLKLLLKHWLILSHRKTKPDVSHFSALRHCNGNRNFFFAFPRFKEVSLTKNRIEAQTLNEYTGLMFICLINVFLIQGRKPLYR